MKCYLDENDVVLSLSDLRKQYDELIKTEEVDYPNCQAWIYNCVHYAGTLKEVEVSDSFQLKNGESELQINLLYVDKQELPSVLTAIIKQNLYKLNNEKQEDGCSIEAAKEHVLAEIEKTKHIAKSLYRLLSVLKSLFSVKYDSSMAYKIATDCDIDSTHIGQIDDDIEEEIAKVIGSIEKVLEIIVPNFKSDSLICEEWFFEDSDYIDVLMKWSNNLEIEIL